MMKLSMSHGVRLKLPGYKCVVIMFLLLSDSSKAFVKGATFTIVMYYVHNVLQEQ